MFAIILYMMTWRGAFLIAGYNTSSPAEKALFDEKKLSKAMGVMISLYTLALFLGIELSYYLDIKCLFLAVILLSTLLLFVGLWYIGNSPRFRRESP